MNNPSDVVAAQVKAVLDEIFAFCSDACDARQSACAGSAEWYKRTGEILAYARMTALLSRLEEPTLPPTRPDYTRRQTVAHIEENTYVILSLVLPN